MELNNTCPLFLSNLYLYDIEACHLTILKSLNFNTSELEKLNKEQRNIQIGLLQKDNKELVSLLRSTTQAIIMEYIQKNHVEEKEIICQQYDGLILTRRISETCGTINLPLRKTFDRFLISSDRKMYITKDKNELIVKGVPNKYNRILSIYDDLLSINYLNKDSIFSNLARIKDLFVKGKDLSIFIIPVEEDRSLVFFKNFENGIKISKNTVKLLDVDEIDKIRYFNFYIKPFTESIVLEFL